MPIREFCPVSFWIWQRLTGRKACRAYVGVVFSLLVTTTIARVYSIVLTRRIQAVISGLSKLRIDESTEEEVLRTVPYVVRRQEDQQVEGNVERGNVDRGNERGYYVAISNESNWMSFGGFASRISSVGYSKDEYPKSWGLTVADWLGYRYLSFSAAVLVLDGRVSNIRYAISDQLVFPRPLGSIVSVESVHAFWAGHQTGFEVPSTDDESPQFRVSGNDRHLSVSYTSDAPPALTSHAFQVHLSCFWNLLGCRHANQVAPLVWQDKNLIEAATVARLKGDDPCPDRILAGRVKYLPDIDVALLESTGSKSESINEEGLRVDEIWTNYKLIEVVRGRPLKLWETVRSGATVPYPGEYNRRLTNMGLRWTKARDRVLAFSNHSFDSCRFVAATPSALSIVRTAVPAPRRSEDEIVRGLM